MIFHIDGNSFYASCERLFRPDLKGKPIAVLANNDGIVIALSAECKALGFKRGDVYFKHRARLEAAGVAVFSSNYTLYADLSSRLNLIYQRFAPEVEVYSIDESFLFFPDFANQDWAALAADIKEAAETETGLPVSVGAAPTKTLAKMCNKLSKKRGGVCVWEHLRQDEELQNYPAGEVWGIGFSKAAFLKTQGILSAFDLKNYPLDRAKKNLTITGMRTVQELNGVPALDRASRGARRAIMCSRSFQAAVYDLDPILAALAEYTQEAVKRLRDDGSACAFVSVYLMTNPWSEGEQYGNAATAELPRRTSYLPAIMGAAAALLRSIYRAGYRYRKVMVCLLGIEKEAGSQAELFENPLGIERQARLMKCFDRVNGKYGRGALHLGTGDLAKARLAACGEDAPWLMQRRFLSPAYTTSLDCLPKVY